MSRTAGCVVTRNAAVVATETNGAHTGTGGGVTPAVAAAGAAGLTKTAERAVAMRQAPVAADPREPRVAGAVARGIARALPTTASGSFTRSAGWVGVVVVGTAVAVASSVSRTAVAQVVER